MTGIIVIVAVMWLVSSLARFANPTKYPIPTEVHYLMGMVITMLGGGTYALSRRKPDDPAPAPPPPTPEVPPRAAESS
jgi:hypothetical protein